MSNTKKSTTAQQVSYAEKLKQPNIPDALFIAWKNLKRLGDPRKISKSYGCSIGSIGRAFRHGNVGSDELRDFISKCLTDRLEFEKKHGASAVYEFPQRVASSGLSKETIKLMKSVK